MNPGKTRPNSYHSFPLKQLRCSCRILLLGYDIQALENLKQFKVMISNFYVGRWEASSRRNKSHSPSIRSPFFFASDAFAAASFAIVVSFWKKRRSNLGDDKIKYVSPFNRSFTLFFNVPPNVRFHRVPFHSK